MTDLDRSVAEMTLAGFAEDLASDKPAPGGGAAAAVAEGRRVADSITQALVVPGSGPVKAQAEQEGLDRIFVAAGFEWREPGCSMCLAMNPDKLVGREISASSSNRNFKGRQGSPRGRTLLMSPAMVAAAAIHGQVVDVREIL